MRISGSNPAVGPHEPENDPAAHATPAAAAAPKPHASAGFPAPPTPANAPSALHKLAAPSKPGTLLGGATLHVGSTGVQTVKFDASSPGNSFGASGKESTAVSVYVNGKYHSSETILSERADPKTGFGAYKVNLGSLPPGDYNVEIRSANDLAGPHSHPAVVRAGSVEATSPSGLEAQVDRYAPLLVTRAPRDYTTLGKIETFLHLKDKPLSPMTRTDIPLRMRAEVKGDPAGEHTIEYHVTFSDEDFGTPDGMRMQKYGRTTDDEWVYKVAVDAQGNRLNETYQFGEDGLTGKRHVPKPFDGMHAGDRPVLRVNSGNNNFAPVKATDKVDRPTWSPQVDFDQGRVVYDAHHKPKSIGARGSVDVIHDFPYIGNVTAEEMMREDHERFT